MSRKEYCHASLRVDKNDANNWHSKSFHLQRKYLLQPVNYNYTKEFITTLGASNSHTLGLRLMPLRHTICPDESSLRGTLKILRSL
jgi:hypothetical protein